MPKSKKTELAEVLKRQILTLELAPGTDLDETQLCAAFDLSRTPVREVFRDLDGLGYVQLREQRSPKVSDLNHMTLRNFFLVAPMIYGAILKLAAESATARQVANLKTAQGAFKESLRSGNAAARTLANYRFHEVTGEMAGNAYLLPSFYRLLIDHARIGMTFYRPQTNDRAQKMSDASAQHDAIIAAIEACDSAAAEQLAEDHWALSRDQMSLYLMPDALNQSLGHVTPPRTA